MVKKLCSILFLGLLALSGCSTQKGPFLMADIEYFPPEGLVAAKPKVVVGVSPFKDVRGKPGPVLGVKKSTSNSIENDLVIQGAGADMVTERFKDALRARGFSVKDVAGWDMTAEGIKAEGVDVLMSGEVKSLWVESVTGIIKVVLKTDVQLRILLADVPEKKMLRTITVSSSLDRKNIAFSFEYLQETISDTLSAAINQIFDDEEIKKKLQ